MTFREYPYWWDTVDSPESRAESQSTVDSPESRVQSLRSRKWDVAIVGAGYTGLAAARQLARSGASVVVFERERVGWGASSRNGGQVICGMKLDPGTMVDRYGEARAKQFWDVSMDAIGCLEALIAEERIECDYRRTGHIQAAWKPSHFDDFRREQALLARVFRHQVDLVPKSEQRSEIGSDAYHGLLVDARSAALNPAQYAAGLGTAAQRAGATIASGVGVTGVRRHSMRWLVSTAAGDIDAADVLLATNGYTDSAAPVLQRRFVPIGSYIVATEPLPREEAAKILPRRRVAFDSKHFLYYFRLTTDDRLLFGGRAEFSKPTAETTRRAAAILRDGLARIFPELASRCVDYAWAGHVAFTRDQMPRAGRLDDLYFAGGYCGHGIAMSTYLGTLIAKRISGQPIEHPLFDDRFAAIPLYRGRPWFLPLAGLYYKLRDLLG